MTSRTRWIVLGLALAGLALSTMAAAIHRRLLIDPTYISPCDLNATFNCTMVYLSRFGTVGGVPVALGGVIWFALVALLAGFRRTSGGADDPTGSYVFVLSVVGLAAVFYLGYASFFILKSGCLLCMGTYACVIGIFLTSGSADSTPMNKLPRRLVDDLRTASRHPLAIAILLLVVVGAAAAIVMFPKEVGAQTLASSATGTSAGTPPSSSAASSSASKAPQTGAPQLPPVTSQELRAFMDAWGAAPAEDVGVPADGAKVVVLKFNDYQCPACKATHLVYDPLIEAQNQAHPGAIKYVLKDFPLNTKCNVNVVADIHTAPCEAAAAVRMARDKGKAKEMADWLWDNQDQRMPAGPIKAALLSIAGVNDFDTQYKAKESDIRMDASAGGALKVTSTPTYFINGIRVKGFVDGKLADGYLLKPELFDVAIKFELTKAGVR